MRKYLLLEIELTKKADNFASPHYSDIFHKLTGAHIIAMTFMNGGEEGFRGLSQTLLFPNILWSGCQGGTTKMFEKVVLPKQSK